MTAHFKSISSDETSRVFQVGGLTCERFPDGRVTIEGLKKDIHVYPKFSDEILALNLMRSVNLGEMEHTFVLSITDRCNIKCDFCCHPFMDSEISEEDAIRLVTEAAQLNYDEICCTGGEPFLKKKTLYKLANICRDNSVLFGVISNGYWAKNRDKAFKMAKEMVEEGFSRVTISWDQSHGEFIDAQTAQNAIDACMDAGLKVCLTGSFKRIGAKHVDYGIDMSAYTPYDNFALYDFPVAEAGMAEENNLDFERANTGLGTLPDDDPLLCTIAHKRELVVYARNGVSQPCCSIFGGYKMSAMSIADWRETSVKDLQIMHEGDPFNRIINVKGFRFVYDLIAERNPALAAKLPDIKSCDSVCHLCSKLMNPVFGPQIREICSDYVSEEMAIELSKKFGAEAMDELIAACA
ncbi:radical SAM protein [Amylibacter sp. IMCC11727]|uniref:radical SAM protein n=1 Tax=Amylibacter sp. IMCC11727 TaxID=3039851 RepID=UPI00244DD438|nr:radical SAM protein [Amylibacter sp. IMCC11727]WGI20719.1 radical SAM protein [Amylibacter sp. IMCC11727]